MLETFRERPDGPRELAIDGITRPGSGRCMVRLVKDQQRAGAKLAEKVAKPGSIDLVRDQRVRK